MSLLNSSKTSQANDCFKALNLDVNEEYQFEKKPAIGGLSYSNHKHLNHWNSVTGIISRSLFTDQATYLGLRQG